jgi:hypothetical protein
VTLKNVYLILLTVTDGSMSFATAKFSAPENQIQRGNVGKMGQYLLAT